MVFWEEVYIGSMLWQWTVYLLIVAGSVLAAKIVSFVIERVVLKAANKTKTQLDDLLVHSLRRPFMFAVFILALWIGQVYLQPAENVADFLGKLITILLTLDVAWFFSGFIDGLLNNYATPLTKKTKTDLDEHLLPIAKRLIKFVIFAIALIMVLDNFGIDVTGLIAGLGLGGLAFALAAQDLLGNMFGGVAILTDKPFKVGDRIRLDKNPELDGVVKEIGLRTSRIQTLAGTFLIIPNKRIADSVLENVSKEKNVDGRRIKFSIGVEYSTSQKKMTEAKQIIEDVIMKHEHTKNKHIVSFNEFGPHSLNILVIYWIPDIDTLMTTQDEINMEIKDRFERARISMAFPTQTIHMKR